MNLVPHGPLAVLAGLLVALAPGCSVLEDADVRISFGSELPDAGAGGLTIRFSDGRSSFTFQARELTGPGESAPRRTFGTASSGDLTVTVSQASAGDARVLGEVILPLRPGWSYDVEVRLSNRSPLRGCSGCAGASFPLDPPLARSPADSLFIVWRFASGGDAPTR